MKINTDRIRMASFVLTNRLKGYRRLQNPKGSNPYEVTMIKTWFGLNDYNNENIDKIYHIKRRRLKKEGDTFLKEEKLLMTRYFMEPKTKGYSGKNKNVELLVTKNGSSKYFEKISMTDEEAENRVAPRWYSDEQKYKFETNLFINNL